MKKKQSSRALPNNSENQTHMIVQDIYSSSGKPLIAVVGKRSKKGNAHLKEIKELMEKRFPDSNSRQA